MPVDDETLLSQMLRVAEANGFDSVHKIYRRIQRPVPVPLAALIHGPPDAWIRTAEAVTGIDAAHLTAGTRRGGRYRSLRTWTPEVDQRLTVYCPACLADDAAWRLAWLLPYATVCHRHQLVLVDHRRSCHERRALRHSWLHGAGSTQICTAERCRFPRGSRPAERASVSDLVGLRMLQAQDQAGTLRLVTSPSPTTSDDPTEPKVLDTRRIEARHEYEQPAYLEFLDRSL